MPQEFPPCISHELAERPAFLVSAPARQKKRMVKNLARTARQNRDFERPELQNPPFLLSLPLGACRPLPERFKTGKALLVFMEQEPEIA